MILAFVARNDTRNTVEAKIREEDSYLFKPRTIAAMLTASLMPPKRRFDATLLFLLVYLAPIGTKYDQGLDLFVRRVRLLSAVKSVSLFNV